MRVWGQRPGQPGGSTRLDDQKEEFSGTRQGLPRVRERRAGCRPARVGLFAACASPHCSPNSHLPRSRSRRPACRSRSRLPALRWCRQGRAGRHRRRRGAGACHLARPEGTARRREAVGDRDRSKWWHRRRGSLRALLGGGALTRSIAGTYLSDGPAVFVARESTVSVPATITAPWLATVRTGAQASSPSYWLLAEQIGADSVSSSDAAGRS